MVRRICFLSISNLFQDNIPSVRQGAAVALANVVRAYGKNALDLIVEQISVGLKGIFVFYFINLRYEYLYNDLILNGIKFMVNFQ